ncbi:SMP-30/gluconolactonase/LRE family protein [Amnibacterium flavum]|uniref:SMP-30/gluconolactonase/LRE family protein n=1 Tax=Amnibacterium flavum TaxID=2173173 RepID=UPI001F0C6AA5|nr:SMP-30/gluconolactonase/LRE family protein [Amnibacterium flavum]
MTIPAAIGEARIWRDGRAILGESLWWKDDALHWCDITAGRLHRGPGSGATDGSNDTVLSFDPPLASFQPRASGGYVIALGSRVVVCDADGGAEREIARVAHTHGGIRFNEGKCDPAGEFQLGSMNITTGEPDAAVYRVTSAGARLVRGGFGTANGFEWSVDETTAYLTDTATETIYRAPWTAEAGFGELVPFISGRMHDGLTIDRDGYLWSGIYGDGVVVRISPEGEVVETVEIPAPNVTSVAFGGDDLSTLFVATARENLTEEQLEAHPQSGGVFAVDTRTAGLPVRTFAG